MRLEPATPAHIGNPIAGSATLDEILGHNARRNGDADALIRPGGSAPQSWREVDASVSALAAVFAGWRLGDDALVGVQLGSSAEAAIACLALWRAGLTAVMLPLAWRRREIISALAPLGASAVLTWTTGAGAPLGEDACEIAAGLDTIRYVGCFGEGTPDGATPLDDVLSRANEGFVREGRPADAADHVAIITFDAGWTPVARTHNELLAATLMPLAAARLSSQSVLVSTLDLAGLAGLATGLGPWLASCCVATFHQPTTTRAMADLVREAGASHLVLPGRVASRLAQDGAFDPKTLSAVTLVWRAPDGRGVQVDLGAAAVTVDATVFGELGIYAAARSSPVRFAQLPLGPAGPEGFPPLIELSAGQDGRLSVRGPACPSASWRGDLGVSQIPFDADGFVDTGLSGFGDRAAGRVSLGGRRRGVLQVGGLALSLPDIDEAYRRSGAGSAPRAQQDETFGARLALAARADGGGPNRDGVASLLEAAGYGPALAPVASEEEPVRRSA